MLKKNHKKFIIVLVVLFVLWFLFFASNTEKAAMVGAVGSIVGQIIVVSCLAGLVYCFCKRKKK